MTSSTSGDAVSSELLARALALNSEGVIVTDADERIIYANQAVQDLIGYSEAEILGRNCRLLQGEDTDPEAVRAIHAAIAAQETFRGPIVNYRKNGQKFCNGLTITPIHGPGGDVTHFVSVQRDISEIVALRESEKREAETARLLLMVARLLGEYSSAADLADSIAEGVKVVCAADRSTVDLWDAPSEQLRLRAQSGWPAHLSDTLRRYSASTYESPELAALVATGHPILVGPNPTDRRQRLLDELEVTAFAAMPITSRGELRGILVAYWANATPPIAISEFLRERLESLGAMAAVAFENSRLLERAVWASTHDSLTGLPDRVLFEKSLQRELAAAPPVFTGVTILYLDIDDFKRTNDTLGHHAGDVVMRHVASVLLEVTGESDVVARFGGDEFVVLLAHQQDETHAHDVAARIRQKLREPLRLSGRDIFVSASIGIAVSGDIDSALPVVLKAQSLITAADTAMYREKAARMGAPARFMHPRELSIDTALHGAVGRGEITTHFQPQFDVRSNTITDVEALARWRNPELGDVSPVEFIPIAEKNGVIHEIGLEVFRQSCALARDSLASGHPVAVSVNVPVIQLMERGFVDAITAVIAAHAIPANLVKIELTESQHLTDVPQIIARLQGIRDLGIGVSLDDFGTGNTSLIELYDLPLTELKIDRAFIQKDGPVGEALISGLVDMAHQIGLEVVAEGIETPHQLEIGRRLGADRLQGHHIARPIGHDDLLAWLTHFVAGDLSVG
ncbi:EAL domain-containing protein [Herbiconiux sp. CPCC 205763]|uniref:EAL domain-containing protein n=1 Tax=Herbiconiux aconitum TaxID=2970913 RepID=A0ABT2GQE4_9MICO|nr:EAL domain-containing protein [Herbiconiux aconitum]MCS5718450.1 EAL domain-containing protein [Herbiconiux aconitum]